MAKVPGSGTQLPEGLALWSGRRAPACERLQEELIVSPEMCLCGALGIGLKTHNQN